MKKNLFILAVAMLGFASMSAQTAPGDNNKMRQPRQFTEFAFEGILLEPAQQVRIDSLNAAMKPGRHHGSMDSVRVRGPHMRGDSTSVATPRGKEGRQQRFGSERQQRAETGRPQQRHQHANRPGKNDSHQGMRRDAENRARQARANRGGHQHGNPGAQCGMRGGAEYVAKVKEILTPEQFEIFMTNISTMPQCPAQGQQCQQGQCQQGQCQQGQCQQGQCQQGQCQQGQCQQGQCQQGQSCKDK